jgi:hypothetical protein
VVGDGRLLVRETVARGVSYDVTVPVKGVACLQILFDRHTGRLGGPVGDPTVIA